MRDDPEGVNDTLPGDDSATPTEPGAFDTDPDGNIGPETFASTPQEIEPTDDDGRTDSIIRWLPTFWLSQKRRKELVTRSSSDGADFAVYASSSRPVAASERVRDEDAVQVDENSGRGAERAARGVLDERSAPTVVTRRTTTGRQRALVLAIVVGLAAGVGAAMLASRWVGMQSPPAAAAAVTTASAAAAPAYADPSGVAASAASSVESASELADRSPLKAITAEGKVRVEPAGKEEGPKLDMRPRAPLAVAPVSSAHTRPTSTTVPSSIPAKDQYFEAP